MDNEKQKAAVTMESKIQARIEVLRAELKNFIFNNQHIIHQYNEVMRVVATYDGTIGELQAMVDGGGGEDVKSSG